MRTTGICAPSIAAACWLRRGKAVLRVQPARFASVFDFGFKRTEHSLGRSSRITPKESRIASSSCPEERKSA